MPADSIRLHTADLFDKFGFQDGDVLSNHPVLGDYFVLRENWDTEDALLNLLVNRYLVPVILKESSLRDIVVSNGHNALHNDVRCTHIGNAKGTLWGRDGDPPNLKPEYVDVPVSDVLAVLHAMHVQKYED